jgi:hypothetical protein
MYLAMCVSFLKPSQSLSTFVMRFLFHFASIITHLSVSSIFVAYPSGSSFTSWIAYWLVLVSCMKWGREKVLFEMWKDIIKNWSGVRSQERSWRINAVGGLLSIFSSLCGWSLLTLENQFWKWDRRRERERGLKVNIEMDGVHCAQFCGWRGTYIWNLRWIDECVLVCDCQLPCIICEEGCLQMSNKTVELYAELSSFL